MFHKSWWITGLDSPYDFYGYVVIQHARIIQINEHRLKQLRCVRMLLSLSRNAPRYDL